MQPANDYIADFLKDINRGRVLQVHSVMKKAKTGSGAKIKFDMPLEDAIQEFAQSSKGVRKVVDDSGKIIGTITLIEAISALTRPETLISNTKYK